MINFLNFFISTIQDEYWLYKTKTVLTDWTLFFQGKRGHFWQPVRNIPGRELCANQQRDTVGGNHSVCFNL